MPICVYVCRDGYMYKCILVYSYVRMSTPVTPEGLAVFIPDSESREKTLPTNLAEPSLTTASEKFI